MGPKDNGAATPVKTGYTAEGSCRIDEEEEWPGTPLITGCPEVANAEDEALGVDTSVPIVWWAIEPGAPRRSEILS